jgi:hypothetical protein
MGLKLATYKKIDQCSKQEVTHWIIWYETKKPFWLSIWHARPAKEHWSQEEETKETSCPLRWSFDLALHCNRSFTKLNFAQVCHIASYYG